MPGGTVTAGNASQQNDAAAACLVVAEDKLAELGLEPMGFLVGWAAAGCDPSHAWASGRCRRCRGCSRAPACRFDDMDLVELNEAFACQVLAVLKGWGWDDPERLNVNGSGISLGHPIGATGVRILTTLLHELQRRERPLRPGDDVHRRRPGPGRHLRACMRSHDRLPRAQGMAVRGHRAPV